MAGTVIIRAFDNMNLGNKGKIISIKQIAERTIETTIKTPEDFNFISGQYIWLMIPELKYPDPKGNTRMFSIASSPNKKKEVDIIFRMSESGYKKTLVEMEPEAEVIFSGPFGSMKFPDDNSAHLVFVAGGVGVAPFLSMIRFSNEINSGHKITLIHANASEQEAVYLDELVQIEKTNLNFKRLNIFGLVKESQMGKLAKSYANQKTNWSVAGPQGFVDFVSKYLNRAGIPLQDIIFEEFYPSQTPKE